MKFKDKYKVKEDLDPKKQPISDDMYALGDVIQCLIDKLNQIGNKL